VRHGNNGWSANQPANEVVWEGTHRLVDGERAKERAPSLQNADQFQESLAFRLSKIVSPCALAMSQAIEVVEESAPPAVGPPAKRNWCCARFVLAQLLYIGARNELNAG
jgi:hypothetical protein